MKVLKKLVSFKFIILSFDVEFDYCAPTSEICISNLIRLETFKLKELL